MTQLLLQIRSPSAKPVYQLHRVNKEDVCITALCFINASSMLWKMYAILSDCFKNRYLSVSGTIISHEHALNASGVVAPVLNLEGFEAHSALSCVKLADHNCLQRSGAECQVCSNNCCLCESHANGFSSYGGAGSPLLLVPRAVLCQVCSTHTHPFKASDHHDSDTSFAWM